MVCVAMSSRHLSPIPVHERSILSSSDVLRPMGELVFATNGPSFNGQTGQVDFSMQKETRKVSACLKLIELARLPLRGLALPSKKIAR